MPGGPHCPQQQPIQLQGTFLHNVDPNTGTCSCSSCLLGAFMQSVYSTQQLANESVMTEMPSPCFNGGQNNQHNGGNGAAPPAMPPRKPQLSSCPMFDQFGFCIYGRTCLLPHQANSSIIPSVPRPATLEEAVCALEAKAAKHYDDLFACDVCSFGPILPEVRMKVGEMYQYQFCPNCTVALYFPQMLHLVELLIDDVGDDYQLYKLKVDIYRKRLPEMLKIPLSYEAHRIATTIFAWSLVSPLDAKKALEVADKHHPNISSVVSVGAGTGYVEHLFNRVANGVGPAPHGPKDGQASTFDGVRANFGNQRPISFFSFDEIVRPVKFSVAVNYGSPQTLMSVDCRSAVLLLCWPPFGSPQEEQSSMGFEALRNFHSQGGCVVVYIGDVASTGDWRFHEMLYTHYELVKDYKVRHELRRWYPQEMGLVYAGNDTIGVYVARQSPMERVAWSWEKM